MVEIRIFEEAIVDTVNSGAVDPNTVCNFLRWKSCLFQVKNVCFGNGGGGTRHRKKLGLSVAGMGVLS